MVRSASAFSLSQSFSSWAMSLRLRCEPTLVGQRLVGVAVHCGDGQRAHGEAFRRHVGAESQVFAGFSDGRDQRRRVSRGDDHAVIGGHVVADPAGDGECNHRRQSGGFGRVHGMQDDSYADHAGGAGNVGRAHVRSVEAEGDGHLPWRRDDAFGHALRFARRRGSALRQEQASGPVDGRVGAHHVVSRRFGRVPVVLAGCGGHVGHVDGRDRNGGNDGDGDGRREWTAARLRTNRGCVAHTVPHNRNRSSIPKHSM